MEHDPEKCEPVFRRDHAQTERTPESDSTETLAGEARMKKLINDVETAMSESLAGFCASHSDILRMGEPAPFVQRRHLTPGKVALLSGGGSGHEPLHTGFVGHGMLDAACPGQVFTPPTPDLILAAAAAAHPRRG